MSMPVERLERLVAGQSHRALEPLLLRNVLLLVEVLLRLFLLCSKEVVPHVLVDLPEGIVLDLQETLVDQALPRPARLITRHGEPGSVEGLLARPILTRCQLSLGADLLGELLDSVDGVDAHHHLLLCKAVLEELVDLDSWLDSKQVDLNRGAGSEYSLMRLETHRSQLDKNTYTDKEDSLHELVVVHVNRVGVDLARVEVVLHIR